MMLKQIVLLLENMYSTCSVAQTTHIFPYVGSIFFLQHNIAVLFVTAIPLILLNYAFQQYTKMRSANRDNARINEYEMIVKFLWSYY